MDETVPGFLGWLQTDAGKVPRIGSQLTLSDHLGACMARWGINRLEYLVPAGLYAIGVPTPDDPVLVTANYKMSYDIVRRALDGRNVWLLVLETFGINVWCAAGKGTFGTDELVRRIEETGLAGTVAHRRLILPILGATGVAAHEVAKRSGFSIKYGTIRAADLPEYLDNGMVTTPVMRALTFSLYERLVLVPVEIVHALKTLILSGALIFLAATLMGGSSAGFTALIAFLGAVLTGLVVAPTLLPWIPMRSFAAKGALAGLIWGICFCLRAGDGSWSVPVTLAALLALPAVSAFYTLNFTGCTNFTSRSGVKKEMHISIPIMGGALFVSILLLGREGSCNGEQQMRGFRYLINVATLELDQALCTGCGRCVEVCPHQVFALEEKLAHITSFNVCMECGACAKNCPVAAIKVEAGVGCATGLISEWFRERGIRGVGGDCCS